MYLCFVNSGNTLRVFSQNYSRYLGFRRHYSLGILGKCKPAGHIKPAGPYFFVAHTHSPTHSLTHLKTSSILRRGYVYTTPLQFRYHVRIKYTRTFINITIPWVVILNNRCFEPPTNTRFAVKRSRFSSARHEGMYGERKYSSTNCLRRHKMAVSDQRHAPAVLTPVTTEKGNGWAPRMVWTLWRWVQSLAPVGNRTPNRPAHYATAAPEVNEHIYNRG